MNRRRKHFNTAGPVQEGLHYQIDPLKRLDLEELLTLIDNQKYFVLHAPRQTGKTSLLLSLTDYLNKGGQYTCLYINVEMAQAARENVKEGMKTILDILSGNAADFISEPFFKKRQKALIDESSEYSLIQNALKEWVKHSSKPVVLIIDELDSLIGDTLISLLRQLRSGYSMKPGLFPQSIILCGVRDVKDYRLHSHKEKTVITGGSAFNIKTKSLKLGNFTPEEIKSLYHQHSAETGQSFDDDAFPLVWELTGGQPWLVNALAAEACFEIKEGRDRQVPVSADLINHAKENLILRRETHLDQLVDKLTEERVRRVIEPILSGTGEAEKIPPDDVDYASDLGLIITKPQIRIANRIYREVIPRELTYSTQLTIYQESSWYIDDKGELDMDKLLTAFQAFFRKHFESWSDGFNYKEAGPQLLLQAFLQRVVNGGGRVEREYGLGRQRTDLLIIWPYQKGVQQVVLELKIRYGSTETTIENGIKQTLQYMDTCGTKEGYLLIFDKRKNISQEAKMFKKKVNTNGFTIGVYGM